MDDKQVDVLINKIIDDFLDREDKERSETVFYPSELPYCYRKNYYNFKCPILFDTETKRIFHVGNIFHNFITFLLKRSFETKLLDSERSLTIIVDPIHDIDIRGRLDNLVILQDENEKTIFEVKSTSNISFMKEAQKHHKMQIIPYLRALQLTKGYIVYVEKNTLKVKVFPVEYDKKIFLEVVERAEKLAKHLRENTLPEPEGRESTWECNLCKYKEMCDSDKNPVSAV